MSTNTLPQVVCGVIPHHMLERVARQRDVEASGNARATLEHMRQLAGSVQTLIAPEAPSDDRQRVYDAGNQYELPGRLVLPGEAFGGDDVQVTEAWDGSGATCDFLEQVFGRRSIDGRGMRLDSTVHYGTGFGNAMWNGRQLVYGDGDGYVFTRFTASLDVIAHELAHGFIQHAAFLGYTGQTGALNEHLADAFGIMVKQYTLGQSADESDWLIGAELFGHAFRGCAVRSLALPGSAYHHPILGRDPQPSHMSGYVYTDEDNGGVHINSGIPNHAFYLAATEIGGKTWKVLGRIWYAALTERLTCVADFDEFARATIDIAGELFGIGGEVQRAVVNGWADVGLAEPYPYCSESHDRGARRRARLALDAAANRRARWRRQRAGGHSSTTSKQRGEKLHELEFQSE